MSPTTEREPDALEVLQETIYDWSTLADLLDKYEIPHTDDFGEDLANLVKVIQARSLAAIEGLQDPERLQCVISLRAKKAV